MRVLKSVFNGIFVIYRLQLYRGVLSYRLRTLSESDSGEKHVISQPKWLCKPRLNGKKSVDKTCAVRRKRAFISSSSEEESDDSNHKVDFLTCSSLIGFFLHRL